MVKLAPGNVGSGALDKGPEQVELEYDSVALQALSNGRYHADVAFQALRNSSPVGVAIPAAIKTIVMEPTTTTLSVDPPLTGGYSPDTAIMLRASANATCGDGVIGDGQRISGLVAFVDDFRKFDSDTPAHHTLGKLRVRGHQSEPVTDGVLTSIECPGTTAVCATTRLEPGLHRISAIYERDDAFNTSTSDPVELAVGGFAMPGSLEFMFGSGETGSKTQTATISRSPFSLSGVSNAALLTASWNGTSVITVTAQPGNLAPGVYEEEVRTNFGSIPVKVAIASAGLSVPSQTLQFLSSGPPNQTFSVTSAGDPLAITVRTESGGAWLGAASPAVANATRQVTSNVVNVLANPAGLPAGDYRGFVDVATIGQSAQTVPVTLHVAYTNATFDVTTEPANLEIKVDGTPYPAPRSFVWTEGAAKSHLLEAPAFQPAGPGVRARFVRWSTGATERKIMQQEFPGSIRAIYSLEYEFQGFIQPAYGGDLSIKRAWIPARTTFQLAARPSNTHPFFGGFVGDLTASSGQSSATVTMDGPKGAIGYFCKERANCLREHRRNWT